MLTATLAAPTPVYMALLQDMASKARVCSAVHVPLLALAVGPATIRCWGQQHSAARIRAPHTYNQHYHHHGQRAPAPPGHTIKAA
jgi:hypothetical protein